MSRKWEPGDVAMVTGEFKRNELTCRRAVRTTSDRGWEELASGAFVYDQRVLDARPLVVIDPEDAEQVERLWAACERQPFGDSEVRAVQAALREFANPTSPKLDEPQGLGAVVEDARGRRWVRTNQPRFPWSLEPQPDDDGTYVWESCRFSDVRAVRVLFEGVSPGEAS